jgi:3-dehydroquinate synthase
MNNKSPTVIKIRAGGQHYKAVVGANLFGKVQATISPALAGHGPRCAIITDSNVARLFGDRIKQSLTTVGFEPILIPIPPGERSKTLVQAGAICDQMIAAGLDRQSFVIGLGGGVVGDISGFVAAIFERGIPHVQIPTTLLAMVDSSIGGKTGVNTSAGKNLLGAVHHPLLVIDDVDVLKSLPRREFNQGFAEIIKHAIIADAGMFKKLTQASGPPIGRTRPMASLHIKNSSEALIRLPLRAGFALQRLIERNIEIKWKIVAKDEFDQAGERALLNFGHTVGHAIEAAAYYREILHGEAVSLGIVAACTVSMKKAGLQKEQRDAVVELLHSFELPTRLPKNFRREKILDALRFDKKFNRGEIRFVVTPKIGSAHLSSEVTMEDIHEAVAQL